MAKRKSIRKSIRAVSGPVPNVCPFCGSSEEPPFVNDAKREGRVCVTCPECAADGPLAETVEAAVRLWNRRDGDPDAIQFFPAEASECPSDQIHTLAGLTCALWDAIGDIDTKEPLPRRTMSKLSALAASSHFIAEGLSNRI